MTIYVLLKGKSPKGLVAFHGVVSSESTAQTWEFAGKSNWYWACEDENGDGEINNVNSKPITIGG